MSVGDIDLEALRDAACRTLCVVGVIGVAIIHIADTGDAYAAAHYLFWLYIVLVVLAVPLVTALVNTRSPLVWVATAAFAAAPLAGYLISRSIGLPGDTDDLGNWMNSLGIASLFVESGLIALSVTRLWQLGHAEARPASLRTGPRHTITQPQTQGVS